MSLLAMQAAFRAAIASPDDDQPLDSIGMTIYRDAYRGRLLNALEVSFERTRQWVGEDPFLAAACHYILSEPPRGWTLDDYGAEFPDALCVLFAKDPEVAELAWLEWHMQRAFAAVESAPLTAESLSSMQLDEQGWDRLRLALRPGVAWRTVTTNCAEIWLALKAGRDLPEATAAEQNAALLVWRQELDPHFRVTDHDEARALASLAQGACLGQIASEVPPEQVGAWLAQWLSDGLLLEPAS